MKPHVSTDVITETCRCAQLEKSGLFTKGSFGVTVLLVCLADITVAREGGLAIDSIWLIRTVKCLHVIF